MALFQPSFIYPDMRSGIGRGVVDASKAVAVSWRINGPSAMVAFQITIYLNNAASTQKYTTGKITTGCPAYGTTSSGEINLFSYTISAYALSQAGITNGNSYKLVITQWWSNSGSITQSSASAFITRAAPSISIAAIGSDGVIGTRYYTFTGNYTQAQGDTLNWFRWRIAYAGQTDSPFFDSNNISGTMDISCTYYGFFANTDYAIRLTTQTENGIESDTGWVNFSCQYSIPQTTGAVTVLCEKDTDAVGVSWAGVGYYPGSSTGYYRISSDNIATIGTGARIWWKEAQPNDMNFDAPWSVIWKGSLANYNATLFTIKQSGGDITFNYSSSSHALSLKVGSTVIAYQTGIINSPRVTALLTEDTLYIREERLGGGLYPATDLYPASTLYPRGDGSIAANIYTIPVTYTQTAITELSVGGYQLCNYIEVLKGEASSAIIDAAINVGTYVPALSSADYLLVNWTNGINAGAMDIGGDTLVGFVLYRRRRNEPTLVKIAETDPNTTFVYDYSAVSQQGPYRYYLFPKGETSYIASPILSDDVFPCWWNWTLMECEATDDKDVFTVLSAYRFRYNVQSGAVSNNNSPNILPNFTPYPVIQLSTQNYKSGTVGGLIGKVDMINGQPRYADTIELRDAILKLSVSQNPLFLKNRKGDLMRIKISGPISMQTDDATAEQMQTAEIPWAEVGSADGISLYSEAYVEADESYYPDESILNAMSF